MGVLDTTHMVVYLSVCDNKTCMSTCEQTERACTIIDITKHTGLSMIVNTRPVNYCVDNIMIDFIRNSYDLSWTHLKAIEDLQLC